MKVKFIFGEKFANIMAQKSLDKYINEVLAKPIETIKHHGRLYLT